MFYTCVDLFCVYVRMYSYVSMGGWCVFQRHYFLVLIHSGVPVVHQRGQPRTGAHSILICQDVTSSGQEGKREGGVKFGWKERDDTQQSTPVCQIGRAHTHIHTHLHKNTHKACQSVNQSMSTWGTRLLPLYPHRHLNTAHWVVQQSAGSARLHTHTVQLWPHWWWLVRIQYMWCGLKSFGHQVNWFNLD